MQFSVRKMALVFTAAFGTSLIACSSDPIIEKPPSPVLVEHTTSEPNRALLAESIAHKPMPAIGQQRQSQGKQERIPHVNIAADTLLPYIANHRSEQYDTQSRNAVIQVSEQATSTFSIDVDTGSYTNVRRFLNMGSLPPADAIRIEEMLNYFSYEYAAPSNKNTPFSVQTEIAPTPWNDKTKLLQIGLQGYDVDQLNRPAANLVFLLDVSGSMSSPNKLPLLKASIKMMLNELSAQDYISIVVYAGASGVVLEPTRGNETHLIEQALDRLNAGGSTNGQAGIELAYAVAEKHKTDTSINRIILATDGDFNVGISNVEQLKALVKRKRESGIALSTLGFGTGNYNDHLMEQLADNGNGAYAYIDTLNEARKVLLDELSATLLTIAHDVKIQIEFNPAVVSEYRLIGYSNRKLANEDFNNDKVDAGEIGAGHSVTALYEVALVNEGGERHNSLRYAHTGAEAQKSVRTKTSTVNFANELAHLRLRYKLPGQKKSLLISQKIEKNSVLDSIDAASNNLRFASAVAGFAQLLFDSKYTNDFDFNTVSQLARGAKGDDHFSYRSEFIQLNELAKALMRKS